MTRGRRIRPLRAATLVVLVLVGVGLWLGLRGLQARDDLEAAQADLQRMRTALTDADVAAARAAATAAAERTERARAATSDPLWRLAGALPRLGATPRTVTTSAAAADDLVRRVLGPSLDAAERLDPATLRAPDGRFDLAAIGAAAPLVERAAAEAARVLQDLESLPTEAVAAPLADAMDELVTETGEVATALDTAASALAAAPQLLGQDRPHRYLVLVQQTAESRGTGGLVGGYVLLETDDGRVRAAAQGSNADLRNGEIPVPPGVSDDFVRLYRAAGAFRLWQNANLSPDVPEVGRVFAARWQAQGGAPLDGVVLLDGQALATILAGSGPIPVPGGSVTPEQLPDYLAVGQYRDFDGLDLATVFRRKDELGRIAEVVAQRLVDGGDTRALVTGVADAVRSGHVRMASDDPVLRQILADAGADRALRYDGPMLYPVVNNATAGKLDHFLDRRVTWSGETCKGDRRRTTAVVELSSAVPSGELPPYLTLELVDGQVQTTRDMDVNLAVYATAGADVVEATVDGAPVNQPGTAELRVNEEAGHPRLQVRLRVPPGGTRTLRLVLDEPALPGEPQLREQPLSRALQADVDVLECQERAGA